MLAFIVITLVMGHSTPPFFVQEEDSNTQVNKEY